MESLLWLIVCGLILVGFAVFSGMKKAGQESGRTLLEGSFGLLGLLVGFFYLWYAFSTPLLGDFLVVTRLNYLLPLGWAIICLDAWGRGRTAAQRYGPWLCYVMTVPALFLTIHAPFLPGGRYQLLILYGLMLGLSLVLWRRAFSRSGAAPEA